MIVRRLDGLPRTIAPRSAFRFSEPARLLQNGLTGSGSRSARIQTSCAVVAAPIFDRALARWCFTVECDTPRRWAAAFSGLVRNREGQRQELPPMPDKGRSQ